MIKKTLLFLGLFTLGSNVYFQPLKAVPTTEAELQIAVPKKPLTRAEKIKTIGALTGCAFFATAALLMPSLIANDSAPRISWHHYPSLAILQPFINSEILLRKLLERTEEDPEILPIGHCINIASAYSSILAYICGSYAIRKLRNR